MVLSFSPSLINKTSKNGKVLFCSTLQVNFMFLWNELRTDRTYSTEPILTYANVSSTNRLYFWTWSSNLGTKVVSISTIKIFAITGPRGEPMTTSSIWI